MSVRELLQAALRAALEAHLPLGEGVTGVFDAPPARAARPYAQVDDTVLTDWGTKDMAGREGRFAVLTYDHGERPVRLRALAGAAEDAIEAMPRDLGQGWRLVTLTLVRSRIVRERDGQWAAMSEWRVRMLRES